MTIGSDAWPEDVVAADFNSDGKIDLAVANNFSDTVSVYLGNGSGGFSLGAALALEEPLLGPNALRRAISTVTGKQT